MRERYKVVVVNGGSSPKGFKHKKSYAIEDQQHPLSNESRAIWGGRYRKNMLPEAYGTRDEAEKECERLNRTEEIK